MVPFIGNLHTLRFRRVVCTHPTFWSLFRDIGISPSYLAPVSTFQLGNPFCPGFSSPVCCWRVSNVANTRDLKRKRQEPWECAPNHNVLPMPSCQTSREHWLTQRLPLEAGSCVPIWPEAPHLKGSWGIAPLSGVAEAFSKDQLPPKQGVGVKPWQHLPPQKYDNLI